MTAPTTARSAAGAALLALLFTACLLPGPASAAALNAKQCRQGYDNARKLESGLAGLLKALQGASMSDLARQTSGTLQAAAQANEQSRTRLVASLNDHIKTLQQLEAAFRTCR